MCLFEYNEKKHIQDERDEAREEGKEEERIRLLVKLVLKNRITIEEAAEEAYMSVEEFKKILEAKKNENKNN